MIFAGEENEWYISDGKKIAQSIHEASVLNLFVAVKMSEMLLSCYQPICKTPW